jgi:hypothetical protein
MASDFLDLEKLRIPSRILKHSKNQSPPRHKPGEKFLKGPIPWAWLAKAAARPGKALHVGIALWFQSAIRRTNQVPLSTIILKELGVSRHAGYRGLLELEKVGLASVIRHKGRLPLVTLRDAKPWVGASDL